MTLCAQVSVLTSQNDQGRTGQNLNETLLTTANVNSTQFGKIFSFPVDGYVYAQPLYMTGVSIAGKGTHNVVFVATENDSVYAFDADDNNGANAAPLWQASFINPAQGVTTVPSSDVNGGDLVPQIGITPTPVIDPSRGAIYVVARTKEVSNGNTSYVQKLHALDITSGAEKFGGPVVIQASVPGSCTPNDGNGNVIFDSKQHNARAALLEVNGIVYITWSSLGDTDPYQGWIMGYNAQTLARVSVLNTVPDDIDSVNHTCRGGIWQSDAGPAADANGDIYLLTGNGSFNHDSGGRDLGDTALRLTPGSTGLTIADYFTPADQGTINAEDFDLGSGGAIVLPDQPGPFPHLLTGAGKEGTIYLMNRSNLGGYNGSTDNIVQKLTDALASVGEFGAPAYFNSTVYYGAWHDAIKAFQLVNGVFISAPVSQTAQIFGGRGCTPAVSANGSANGILWALQTDGYRTNGPVVLHAFDAGNLASELYNSSQAGERDDPGPTVKFTIPTVANGKVYVGTETSLTVMGPLNLPFVAHNYFDVLDRSPDQSGLTYYVNGLNTGLTQTQVVYDLFSSQEFANSSLFVASAYLGLLGRDPDYPGWSGWVNFLRQQGQTQQALLTQFASSSEFAARFGNSDDLTYVTLLYQDILHRNPSSQETTYWTGALSGGETRAEVAGNFIVSPEFLNENRPRLNADLLYLVLLRRAGDAAGLDYWEGELDAGVPLTTAISGFLASPEYIARYSN